MNNCSTTGLFATRPKRSFRELDYHDLVIWLYKWGHGWPTRFIDVYGIDFVRDTLDVLVESPDDPNPKMTPAALVNAVRSFQKADQEQAGITHLPRAPA